MEIWIRSQDKKKLLKATSFELDNDETTIFANNYDGDYVNAGKYKSKERALEVLDEIQQIINGEITMPKSVESQIVGYRKIIELNVYEMPKE